MAQVVRLHGGPWHDRIVAVEDGRDHFHILEPWIPPQVFTQAAAEEQAAEPIKSREGMYSCVRSPTTGRPSCEDRQHIDFEWDGWRSHD